MLRTEQLSLAYGSKPVVDNVSLAIPEGGITCRLGPIGSGKSTLLKSFAGLLPARKAFQQSTFTRTVGAQQAGNPTLGNGQRDVVHDRLVAIGKRELLGS